MAARDLPDGEFLVGYDYIAAGLGVTVETARIYPLRHEDFPTRVNPGQRSVMFRRADADQYIARHRRQDPPAPVTTSGEQVGYDYIAAGLGVTLGTIRTYQHVEGHEDFPTRVNPDQRGVGVRALFARADADRYIQSHQRQQGPTSAQPVPPVHLDLSGVVDFSYIAEQLGVTLKTVYKYGTPTSAQFVPGFPAAVTRPGSRTPLFDKREADAFIAERTRRPRRIAAQKGGV